MSRRHGRPDHHVDLSSTRPALVGVRRDHHGRRRGRAALARRSGSRRRHRRADFRARLVAHAVRCCYSAGSGTARLYSAGIGTLIGAGVPSSTRSPGSARRSPRSAAPAPSTGSSSPASRRAAGRCFIGRRARWRRGGRPFRSRGLQPMAGQDKDFSQCEISAVQPAELRWPRGGMAAAGKSMIEHADDAPAPEPTWRRQRPASHGQVTETASRTTGSIALVLDGECPRR